MYSISKQFYFSASHQLIGLPDGHPCGRLHGHNYIAELILRSPELDEHDFVVDYGDLKPFGDYIVEHFDHRHLNDIIEQPTAETIARHLYLIAWQFWHDLHITVRVSETAKTWAEYADE